jgi:hypothetical protein
MIKPGKPRRIYLVLNGNDLEISSESWDVSILFETLSLMLPLGATTVPLRTGLYDNQDGYKIMQGNLSHLRIKCGTHLAIVPSLGT